MFGRPELMFKVKLKPYGEVRDESIELPLIFFSAFERVALESDDKMHRMGNIIQLYEPGRTGYGAQAKLNLEVGPPRPARSSPGNSLNSSRCQW